MKAKQIPIHEDRIVVTSQETSDWRRRHLCDTDPEKHRGGEAGTKGVWRDVRQSWVVMMKRWGGRETQWEVV